jgi:hypothetical protein
MKLHQYIGICLFLYPLVALSEQYLCVPDKMTGFAYDAKKKEWDYMQFNTNFKWVIAPANNGRDAFVQTKVGDKDPEGYCKQGFNEGGFLFCSGLGGDLKFNRNNGRYLMVFTMGYYVVGKGQWAETDADSGTPMVQIGKCSAF